MSKYCPSCDCTRPRTAFSLCRASHDGLQRECKKCHREGRKPDVDRERMRQWRQRNKDRTRRYSFLFNLKKLYGMTEEEYEALLLAQGNRCGICTKLFVKTPHIDHDHKTGKVRGLLCNDCNTGLGRFKDDFSVVRAAVRYLKRNGD